MVMRFFNFYFNFSQNLNFKLFVYFRFFKLSFKKFFKKKSIKANLTIEKYILFLTGCPLSDFSNALSSASFLLIFIKISFFLFFSFQIPFRFNLLLLLGLFGLSIMFNINFYIRFIMYKILKNTLSDYFFGLIYSSWDASKEEFDVKEGMVVMGFQNKAHDLIKLPVEHWYHKLVILFYTLIIQIRLFMFSEPFLFFFGRFFIIYWLLMNKYLILIYIASIIVLIGRYILLYQTNDFKAFFIFISPIWNNKTIKPTYKNAFLILAAITNEIKIDYNEEDRFYTVEKEPQNKYTKKYKKLSNKEIIGYNNKIEYQVI